MLMNKKRKQQFVEEYNRLCTLHNCCPIRRVLMHVKEHSALDFNTDRIVFKEWEPILGALRENDSLKNISLHSLWPSSLEGNSLKVKRKPPAMRSKELTSRLSRAVKDCLANSTCIECLVFQNIPIPPQCIHHIMKGVQCSSTLKYLSLEKCHIGDKCFKVVCNCIRSSNSLVSVNFSGCGLTYKSAEEIAQVIKFQATNRHSEAWQASLRYRKPNLDQMHGLRRITCCSNRIGDTGARILADALKDDLWVKAMDLQQCGISTEGAAILKESISLNKTLLVLDLRRNPSIEYDMLRSVIEQVMVNANGEQAEYPWRSGNDTLEKNKTCPKRRPRFNVNRTYLNKSGRSKTKEITQTASSMHYPWRTEARSKRHNTTNLLDHTLIKTLSNHCKYDDHDPDVYMQNKVCESYEKKRSHITPSIHPHNSEGVELRPPITTLSPATANVSDHYKEKYKREKCMRMIAVAKVRQLEEEKRDILKDNERLKEQMQQFQKPDERQPLLDMLSKGKLLDEENVLESIEASFAQFQRFLDMLKDLGLGDLCKQISSDYMK